MSEDNEGFLQPVINNAKCVKCGLCEKVCPVLFPDMPREPSAIYVVKAKDNELRLKSSSGGVFSLLAREVFKQGGIVYGAGWERPSMRAVHKSAQNEGELDDLRGSKYVQSEMGGTYRQVESQLKDGRVVLFCGCPCQVAGLKHFLRYNYDNLICVDLICHSIGSPGVFKRFLSHLSGEKEGISSIVFRDKAIAWKHFHFRVRWYGGEEYLKPFNETFYGLAWWSGLAARRSCFGCKFKSFRSLSDITIGDAWGVEEFAPEMDDEKGCSIVFLFKDNIFSKTISKMHVRQIDYLSAVNKNPCVYVPSHKEGDRLGILRERFYREINRNKSGLTKKNLLWFNNPGILKRAWRKGLRVLGF